MTLSAKRALLVATFTSLPDSDARFFHLINLGRRYPPLDPALKADAWLVPGCVSRLWFIPQLRDGRCAFALDAEAAISKGVAALVCDYYEGATPEEILTDDLDFRALAGLQGLLSPNRSNGLASLLGRIRAFAAACPT
ncbi:MAG: SufE family protein [Opitutaceae bacterium]|nr:SufE family protein [Opitutaceae bacterium]